MMIYPIIAYGDSVLRKRAQNIEKGSIDVKKFSELPSKTASYVPAPNLPPVYVPPMYAAFLNPQGRFLYDLFLYRKPLGEERLDGSVSDSSGDLELFADVDSSVLDELLQTFKK